jgi:hypothetical protein
MFSAVNKHNNQGRQQPQVSMNFFRMPMRQPVQPVANVVTKVPEYAPSDGDKMKWGKHIWAFFHTIANNVKEESFPHIRKELLDIIYSICCTLPCPVCSEHAKEYMKSVNFNAIQKKEDLIKMLFDFHNAVNARKRYRRYEEGELKKYNKEVLNEIIVNFLIAYNDRQRSLKLYADDLQRRGNAKRIGEWLQKHIIDFTRTIV